MNQDSNHMGRISRRETLRRASLARQIVGGRPAWARRFGPPKATPQRPRRHRQGKGQIGDPGVSLGRHVAQRHVGPEAGVGTRIHGLA
jgi:hypothetical protein